MESPLRYAPGHNQQTPQIHPSCLAACQRARTLPPRMFRLGGRRFVTALASEGLALTYRGAPVRFVDIRVLDDMSLWGDAGGRGGARVLVSWRHVGGGGSWARRWQRHGSGKRRGGRSGGLLTTELLAREWPKARNEGRQAGPQERRCAAPRRH